jgi:hypothetical protein
MKFYTRKHEHLCGVSYYFNIKIYTRMKVKTIYNDKKMVFKNPYGRRDALARDVGQGIKPESHHQPLIGAARYNFARWGKEILQTKPERFARSVPDAGHAQGG